MHYWDSEQPIRLPRLDTLPYFPAKVQAKRILAELKREFPKQSQLRQFVKALVARFGPELLCHVAKPDLALTHMEDLVYSVVSANPAGYGYGGSAESLRDIIFGSDEWLEFLKSADTSPASQSAIPTREENNVITAVRVTPLAGSGNAPVVSTPTAVKAAATREDLFKEFFRSVPARELAKTSPRTFVHWAISQKKPLPAHCRTSRGVRKWKDYLSPRYTTPFKHLSSAYYSARKYFLGSVVSGMNTR